MVGLLTRQPPPEVIERIRMKARQRLPLGQIAKDLGMDISEVRTIADLAHISVVRDNREGSARPLMAHRAAASAYVAMQRQPFVAKQLHVSRLAKAKPLTPQQEAEAIARFLETKGPTQCPTVYLETDNPPGGGWLSGVAAPKKRGPGI